MPVCCEVASISADRTANQRIYIFAIQIEDPLDGIQASLCRQYEFIAPALARKGLKAATFWRN